MEAIKCPNCGSEKVQELTEEKYICLACDNVFLVHNLSKEFRKTDAHISDVHEDLSKKLDSLNVNLKTIESVGSVDNTKVKEILFEAEQTLQAGKFLESYMLFKKYTVFVPDSYVGYEGMFRALTNDYQDDAGEYKTLAEGDNIYDCLLDGTDVLKKALECEDADKDDILAKYEMFYTRSAETLKRLKYGTEEEIKTQEESRKETVIQQHEQSLEAAEQKIKKIEQQIENANASKVRVADFKQLSESEKKKAIIKGWIPFIIMVVISIAFWGRMGILLHIIDIIAIVVTVFVGLAATPAEISDDELNQKKQDLKEAEAALEELKKRDVRKELEEVNTEDFVNQESNIEKFMRLICENNTKIFTADELYRSYSKMKNPKEVLYDVVLTKGVGRYGALYEAIANMGGIKLYNDAELPQVIMKRLTKSRASAVIKVIEQKGGTARMVNHRHSV